MQSNLFPKYSDYQMNCSQFRISDKVIRFKVNLEFQTKWIFQNQHGPWVLAPSSYVDLTDKAVNPCTGTVVPGQGVASVCQEVNTILISIKIVGFSWEPVGVHHLHLDSTVGDPGERTPGALPSPGSPKRRPPDGWVHAGFLNKKYNKNK